MHDKQELIDIVEVVYRGARKGHGLVVSPKGAPLFSRSRHSLRNAWRMRINYLKPPALWVCIVSSRLGAC